jgi:putative heme iron utilization protein
MSSGRSETGGQVRRLLRALDRGALATNLADGGPYASLVLLALDLDATPLLLLSDLAEHSRNLARDGRACLLADGTAGLADPLTGTRASLVGRVAAAGDPRLLARYVARHPSAEAYAGFADFKLYRLDVERAHLVAGFGKIQWIEGAAIRLPGAAALAEAEPAILAHMNADHGTAIETMVGRGPGWRMTGIDPEGADFRLGGDIARVDFASEVWNAAEARAELVRLARPRT